MCESLGDLKAEMVGIDVRRKLAEESLNLEAAPSSSDGIGPPKIIALPTTRSSGSFSAVPKNKKEENTPPPPLAIDKKRESPPSQSNQAPESRILDKWKIWVIISSCILLLIIIIIFLWRVCRSRALKTFGPWRTGISGRLQKAFVTGNLSFLFVLQPVYPLYRVAL